MGSHWNFKNMGGGDAPPLPSQAQAPAAADGSSGSGRPPGNLGNLSLARQASIYSLTFDEFQNTMGGNGKDFGSMNMDELIKNIWTAEEAQAMASSFGGGAVEGLPGGNLQRQGSLTLPRTLSQKTVDEVWRDLYKESFGGGKDGNSNGGSNLPQRQQTLGEITLEEFLVRAGVVREDMQAPPAKLNNNGFYPELMHVNNHNNNNSDNNNNNPGLSLGFGQLSRNSVVIGSQIAESNNPSSNQSPSVAINANGVRSPNGYHHHQQQQQQLKQSPQQLFPRQPNVAYASPLHLTNVPMGGQRAGGGIVGIGDPMLNNNLMQGGGLQGGRMGMGGFGVGTVTVATGSPANQLSSDGIVKSNGEMPSPVPSVFNGMRGKRSSGTLEKVVERRQRRMIKNRESAARSRARKQAYTMELEAEVAKLKEENQELQKKQAEILEMQKNQVLEIMNKRGLKKRCLRRTLTGPW